MDYEIMVLPYSFWDVLIVYGFIYKTKVMKQLCMDNFRHIIVYFGVLSMC